MAGTRNDSDQVSASSSAQALKAILKNPDLQQLKKLSVRFNEQPVTIIVSQSDTDRSLSEEKTDDVEENEEDVRNKAYLQQCIAKLNNMSEVEVSVPGKPFWGLLYMHCMMKPDVDQSIYTGIVKLAKKHSLKVCQCGIPDKDHRIQFTGSMPEDLVSFEKFMDELKLFLDQLVHSKVRQRSLSL